MPETLFPAAPPDVVELYRQRVIGEYVNAVKQHSDALNYTFLVAFCWLHGQEITTNAV